MANTFAPQGLLSYGGADGAAPTYGLKNAKILYSNTDKIFYGDPVMLDSGGYVQQWDAGTGVSQMVGIFRGCKYYSLSNKQTIFPNYWPGADVATNADIVAYIEPVNTATPPMFLVQTANSNTTAVAVTQASVGQNADVALGSGNTNTGMSTAYLDINTFGTEATKPFRIIQIWQGVGNGSDTASAYNNVLVQANIYQETGI
jgi:hypothetical protein